VDGSALRRAAGDRRYHDHSCEDSGVAIMNDIHSFTYFFFFMKR
jgi:hypothetical protein